MSQLPFLLPANKASQLRRNRLHAPSQWPPEQQAELQEQGEEELRSKHTEGEMEVEHMSTDRYLSVLKSRLYHMMRSGDYSDIMFTVDGETVRCHKNILAATCPYFDTMFKSQITGADTHEIEIKTTPKHIFKAIINFIYTGELSVCAANAQHLLEASDLMQFDDLKIRCCQFFIREMDPTNCCGIWQLSCAVNAPHLQEQAFMFAAENFPELSDNSDEFIQLEGHLLRSLVTYPHLNSPSEDLTIERLLSWLDYSPDERMATFSEVLHSLPLHTVTLQALQYGLLKNEHVKTNAALVEFVQGLMNHLVFLSPLPTALVSSFPRTKAEYTEGLAVLSKESLHRGNTRMKLSFYRFENKDCLSVAKSEDLPLDFRFSHESTLCCVDNTIYLCNGEGMSKYDMATKVWTECNRWAVAAKHKIILTEGKRLLSLEHSHFKCPVSEYNFLENTWTRIGSLKKKLTTDDFTLFEHQGVMYVCGGNHEMADMIQAYHLSTNTGYLLSITLPSAITGLQCLVYKHHVIVMGMEATYIYLLTELRHMTSLAQNEARAEEPPKTPTKVPVTHRKSNSQSMETETGCSSQSKAPFTVTTPESCETTQSDDVISADSDAINVISKPGISRKHYGLSRLGSELIIFAGSTHHPKFCKEVQVTGVDGYLKAGVCDTWRTVAMLSEELNRYNISLYKSVPVTFKQ